MQSTRRFLALAVLGVAGMAPAVLPAAALAQSDPGADDLMRRLRGAPGSRVGGATRGIKRDNPADGTAPTPAATPAPASVPGPGRVAATSGG